MKYIFLLLLLSTAAFAQGEPSKNMTLFDRLNPVDSTGPHSALWGYTAPDGREYAVFGSQIGTHIIDITERPIREVAYIWGPRSPWREMKVYGQHAYVVSESHDSGAGMQIIDLSDLPRSATLVRTDSANFVSGHTIYIRDHYLYAMGARMTPDGAASGAIILDLEPDPVHPRRVGEVSPYYYHDAWVRNDTLLGSAVYGQGLDLYDIRDKANPVHMATITYPGSGTHNAELTRDGRYAATSDEIGLTPKTMKVWDISNLDNITKVADYSAVPNDVIHNIHFDGRYAAVAWYTAGVRMIDMIDPTHPREVGFYDTYPGASGTYDGVWEVFPYFPSGKIIASDRQTGLWVLEFNDAVAGSYSGVVRSSRDQSPLPGVTITIPETGQVITTDALGRYYVGGAVGDNLTLVVEKFTYGGVTRPIQISGERQEDILLDPLSLNNVVVTAVDEQNNPILDFSFAIEPWYSSESVVDGNGSAQLPKDSTYTILVGRWGYALERKLVTVTGDQMEVKFVLHRRYHDDATLDLGWRYADPTDRAISGHWTRIIPYLSTPNSQWILPPTGPSGTPNDYVFMTGAPVRGGSPFENEVTGGTTTLTSPLMDLRDHPDPEVTFDLWFVHFERDTVVDTMVVELTNNDGATWVPVYTEVQGKAGWKTVRFYPQEVMPLTSTMRVRFRASDTLGTALVMAAIDNFHVAMSRSASHVEDAAARSLVSMAVVPNPVRDRSIVTVRSAGEGRSLRVELFNAIGEKVATLFDGTTTADGMRLATPAGLAPGWYHLRATVDGVIQRGEGFTVVR